MEEKTYTFIPPYISFKSFINTVQKIISEKPTYVDDVFLQDIATSIKPRMISALKSFQFIDNNKRVTETLKDFVLEDTRGNKDKLKNILVRSYSSIMQIGLDNITSEQLEDELKKYNLSGSTLVRSRGFLLQVAEYVGLPIRQELKTTNNSVTISMETNNLTAKPMAMISDQKEDRSSECHTINLKSGGKVTVDVSIPIFKLSKDDRNFVFEIIDRLKDYEQESED